MLRILSLAGNDQELDGGALYGHVPRVLWSRWTPPDELGRVRLACRCLLIEDAGRRILLEAGVGLFFAPHLRERYGIRQTRHVLLDALAALDLSDADIDVVVLSHLHFDHVGGLLAPYEAGRPPRLLFPRARFLVSSSAFERACSPRVRDRASFVPEVPDLLTGSGRLVTCADAVTAERELGDRFRVHVSEGHTPGMFLVEVRGQRSRVVFGGDLVPGAPWVHLPVTTGYDRHAELLVEEKEALYRSLGEDGYLFFNHDPNVPLGRVRQNAEGRWECEGLELAAHGADLDAEALGA
jgi:glyoxylase-like metal-dependent hydrolase (beta-lactamase superfamily II)